MASLYITFPLYASKPQHKTLKCLSLYAAVNRTCFVLFNVQMLSGYLRARRLVVQRERVRQSLKRVDTLSSAVRWSQTVTRRTYSVPTPNALWHLDAHMKLVRFASYVLQSNMLPT